MVTVLESCEFKSQLWWAPERGPTPLTAQLYKRDKCKLLWIKASAQFCKKTKQNTPPKNRKYWCLLHSLAGNAVRFSEASQIAKTSQPTSSTNINSMLSLSNGNFNWCSVHTVCLSLISLTSAGRSGTWCRTWCGTWCGTWCVSLQSVWCCLDMIKPYQIKLTEVEWKYLRGFIKTFSHGILS